MRVDYTVGISTCRKYTKTANTAKNRGKNKANNCRSRYSNRRSGIFFQFLNNFGQIAITQAGLYFDSFKEILLTIVLTHSKPTVECYVLS